MAGSCDEVERRVRRLSSLAQSQMPQYPLCGFASFENGSDHQIRAAHHVAARKNLRVRGLESGLRGAGHAHSAIAV
jgi:hypothetical protein